MSGFACVQLFIQVRGMRVWTGEVRRGKEEREKKKKQTRRGVKEREVKREKRREKWKIA